MERRNLAAALAATKGWTEVIQLGQNKLQTKPNPLLIYLHTENHARRVQSKRERRTKAYYCKGLPETSRRKDKRSERGRSDCVCRGRNELKMTGKREKGHPPQVRMTGRLSGRSTAALEWDNPGKCGPSWENRGSLPRLSHNSLSTSTGRWPIMAARRRRKCPERRGRSFWRELERSPENVASSSLTPKHAAFRVAANHRAHLTDRQENRPIDILSPALYATTATQAR